MIISTGAQNHFPKSIHKKNLQQTRNRREFPIPDTEQYGETYS